MVYYTIQVQNLQTNEIWEFKSRYSIMRDVHKDIVATLKDDSHLPKFPRKRWFGNTDVPFITQRQKELQHYFSTLTLLFDIEQIPPLKSFLYKEKKVNEVQQKQMLQKEEQIMNNKPQIKQQQ